MATTSIWKIEGRIDKVLGYVENPEKTTATHDYRSGVFEYNRQELMALRDVMDYAVDGGKTDSQQFVSGINCDAATARQQMILSKKQWGKEDGIVAFHGYQSFTHGEVSAELAHKIGIELAEKLWGDRFEVIVATHLNTNCYHNHFVLNSVSFVDGKRFYRNNSTYRQMRKESDKLCQFYSLSVVKEYKGVSKSYTEWQAERDGRDTWKAPIRQDIDDCIAKSLSFPAFVRALKSKGYTMRFGENIKYMSVKPPGYGRSVRVHRLGDDYTEAAIKRRITEQRLYDVKRSKQKTKRYRTSKGFQLTRLTWKGIRAQHYYYLSKLKKAQRRPQQASFVLKNDLRYMDKLCKHSAFMAKHGLETKEQIVHHDKKLEQHMGKLVEKRERLRKEMRRVDNADRKEEYSNMVAAVTQQIKPLREERKLCAEILQRSEMIKQNMQLLKAEAKGKEEIHESRTRRGRTNR